MTVSTVLGGPSRTGAERHSEKVEAESTEPCGAAAAKRKEWSRARVERATTSLMAKWARVGKLDEFDERIWIVGAYFIHSNFNLRKDLN